MSNGNTLMIGGVGLFIPADKWYDVATLKTDLRPAIKELQKLEVQEPTQVEAKHPIRPECRKGCLKTFVNLKRRRIHERKYHV